MSTKGSRTAVTAEVSLGLVGPENGIVPLMASLTYSCADPYAVTMAFHVGTAEPVEWTLARDLLAAALHSREGIGDVQAWPSAASAAGEAAAHDVLNISMTSPFGHARFEASARDIEHFLARTFEVVPQGGEPSFMNFDDELTDLLSQGLGASGTQPEGVGGGGEKEERKTRGTQARGRSGRTQPLSGRRRVQATAVVSRGWPRSDADRVRRRRGAAPRPGPRPSRHGWLARPGPR
jgi:hypothetical protein